MIERNFLILVEGRKDSGTVGNLLKLLFENIVILKTDKEFFNNIQIKIIKDSTSEIGVISDNRYEQLEIKSINDNFEEIITNVYIKRATNQNIKTFNDDIKNNIGMSYSLEKIYNLKNLTYAYSIFDFDPGSTTDVQLEEYFKLKEVLDNFYPIINYPGIEAQEIHINYSKIFENFDKIESEFKIQEFIDNLYIDVFEKSELIYLKRAENISKIIKSFQKQMSRFFKENEEEKLTEKEKCKNYLKYLKIANIDTESFQTLEEQENIFRAITSKEKFLLISFTISIFENICEWIIDEDE